MAKKYLLSIGAEAPAAPETEQMPEAHTLQSVIDQEINDNDEEFFLLKNNLPKGVNIRDAIDFGFYEHKNRYWMRRKGDTFEPISNFILSVKFLIVGANPKRIVEIKNCFNKSATIDFMIEDLISLEKFKGKVESQGNFLFDGVARDLARIKSKLFNIEKPSVEISRLGQYKDKFFVWANGIYQDKTNQFLPIDDNGMVMVGDDNYYIPVLGATRSDDDEDLRNYRRFQHGQNNIKFADWADLFYKVYGENGQIGIAYTLYALFSDVVFEKTKAAPMLFLFGQRSSGKGTMANSMLSCWGTPQDPLMLGGASTVVGFMRKLGQFSNALVWLDEYKNDIGEKKIESMKNIWDRVGYERGVKDSSNRTQTTPVTSSAIVSGQEMPNGEPALFSRMVLVEFRNAGQREQAAVDRFNKLRILEDSGITAITLEVLRLREYVKQSFVPAYNEIATLLRSAFSGDQMPERLIVNYSILIAMVKVVGEQLELPFTFTNLIVTAEKFISRQNTMMSTANEVQQFFEMVAFLLTSKLIEDGRDIMVKDGFIKIRLVTIIGLYREHSRKQGLRTLDRGTLVNYLQNSSAFVEDESKRSSHRFPKVDSPTSAYVFHTYDVQQFYGVDFQAILQNTDNEPITDNSKKVNPF
jgi:hypothetical protein